MVLLLRTHTALGRLAFVEAIAAINYLVAQGYVITAPE